jgi:hypothetical protein
LQLRAAKPKHATWSCAEVRAAFEALASVHSLAAESSAAVVRYFADETVDGVLLSVLAADADILKALVPNSLRRHRLSAVLTEMCADSVGGVKAPVAVPVPVPVAAALAPWPVAVTVAMAGTASPHAASAASCVSNDEEQVVSPVCTMDVHSNDVPSLHYESCCACRFHTFFNHRTSFFARASGRRTPPPLGRRV